MGEHTITADRQRPKGTAPLTLRARKPGYAVMQQCLAIQAEGPPRTARQRFWGHNPLRPEARSWFTGAIGERQVATQLEQLGPDFTVLHAVPIGTGTTDIDHVVVGPTGVFSINTKNHSGHAVWAGGRTLMVNGQRTPHLHRALTEGQRATSLLSAAAGVPILVQPILVVAAAELRFGKKSPAAVILQPEHVGRWVRGLPRVHSDEAVRFLSMLAEERGTWHVDAVVIDDTLRHVQRFERLEREIADARSRRSLMRRARVLAVLAVPAGGLLGYWWAVAATAMAAA
ncbi:NERD domain-containing protein [Curtobacterium sp. YC1]|uniref:nuclease-related domain-containing protein n=1 Tax=Curtobacterium sp. YC1 TaxID=2795488 RepID=UPI0018E593B3|nr:nuclease-related domain-containing protein [Curtobacterium sp. YC1]QQD77259.1 NERD domain-containing protein [Curtobacterium sp. YC1]